MAADCAVVAPLPDPRVGIVVLTHNRADEVLGVHRTVRSWERLLLEPVDRVEVRDDESLKLPLPPEQVREQ